MDEECAEAVVRIAQAGINTLGTVQDLAIAASVRREQLVTDAMTGGLGDGSDHAPEAQQTVAAGLLSDPDLLVRVTRADALTGVTVARDPYAYLPNAALARRVRDRDRTCRFPCCGVATRRCDLDHLVPFPDGNTSEDNLVTLCRSHHGFKHHARWTLTLDRDGSCHWTGPNGRTHTTRPADLRLDAA